MKILFAATEAVPFCKTGGLADVIGALPKALRRKRHDVRVMLPKYKSIRVQEFGLKQTRDRVRIPMGETLETGEIWSAKSDTGVPFYFIQNDGYFGRPGLYRSPDGDYPDNAERFIFFSRAVLEACKAIDFQPDILHCHDWQTGLVATFLKLQKKTDAFFQHTSSAFTIHNLAYQGIFPRDTLLTAGLPWSEFTYDKLEFHGKVSFLKAGLAYSDILTTVSPTYAKQIQSSPEFGAGMEGLLQFRASDLVGILNGLDLEEWNPAQDPFLAKPFDAQALATRADCKTFLQQSLKLPHAPRAPLLGIVARLDWQKGIDLLADIVPDLAAAGAQIVILGQGDEALRQRLERLELQFPENFRLRSDFNEPLAHHIYGGIDLFLMPSRFEPCGLGQMIAMRYGAIPVVMYTGGLADTVQPVGAPGTGNGFVFYDARANAFLATIKQALALYASPTDWAELQKRAMRTLFPWDDSAQRYVEAYHRALGRGNGSRKTVTLP